MVDFNDQYRMTIAGCLLAGTETFKAFNPATKKAIADVPNASAAQLDEAVTSARAAFATWRHSSFEQRRDALNGIAELLESTRKNSSHCSRGNRASRAPMRNGKSAAPQSGAARSPSSRCPTKWSWTARASARGHALHGTRRRRRHHAVEFPGAAGHLEDRAGAGHRQLHHRQAFAFHAPVHTQARRAVAGQCCHRVCSAWSAAATSSASG